MYFKHGSFFQTFEFPPIEYSWFPNLRRGGFWSAINKLISLFSLYRIKIFHYNGAIYFKKMFDKLFQVRAVHLSFLKMFSTTTSRSFPHANIVCRPIGSQSLQISLVKPIYQSSQQNRSMLIKRKHKVSSQTYYFMSICFRIYPV